MFGTLRIGDKATVYWRECGEVLSHFVVRDDGLSALALLHARQPQTVAPDVTQYPHAGILPASLAGAGRQRSLGAGHTARRHDRDGPVCDQVVVCLLNRRRWVE